MLLEDGRLSCITCHFVHPFSIKFKKFTYSLLRRPGKGKPFCSACHRFDENDHIVFENLHMESYQLTDLNSQVDTYTLQCIECHNDKVGTGVGLVDAGKGRYSSSLRLNHPIGVSYVNVSTIKPHKFNPPSMLSPEIRLVKDKVGCGTCHNAYSKNGAMLVRSNSRSRLCLACHKK
jgi:predicted CXXCH cytochrome family protein